MPFDPYALTTWHLASLADCGSPDQPDRFGFDGDPGPLTPSPGAEFLRTVAIEVDNVLNEHDDEPFDLDTLKDEVSQYVDSSVPIYTHNLWQTFVDLAAYQEDVSEYGDGVDDLTKLAQVALYIIGERLAYALLDDYAESIQPEEDDESEEDA